jgi:CubicO group peptidase (beta-lactamase class C family)/polyisoprenoid-binding protein YceI
LKKLLIITFSLIVIALLGGYALYDYYAGNHIEIISVIKNIESPSSSPSSSSPTSSPSSSPTKATDLTESQLNKHWVINAESQVFFSVTTSKESVNFIAGKTQGDWNFNLTKPEQMKAKATIDVTGLDSGNSDRDNDIKGFQYFDTNSNPTASFEAQSFPQWPTKWREGEKIQFKMNGIITVKSIAKNVVVNCEAIYELNQIKLSGKTSVTFSDFGMTNPHTLVLSTENDVQIQLELILDASASDSPKSTSFVWKESTLKDQGIDEALIGKIDEEISKNYKKIYSLLIIKNGFMVYEKYYHSHDKDTITPVFSVTKSVLSALTGIAIKEGNLSSVDQKISDLIPDNFNGKTENKKEITIRHALTMTGGLDSVDANIGSWFKSSNYVNYVIDQPLTSASGTKFVYNTGLTHLLSAVLTKATGKSTKAFADQYLFGPLEITNYKWDMDPQGVYNGGTNLSLTPRDMAKLGYVYLHHGKWEGKQLIPEAWVAESTKKQIDVNSQTNYGYLFWISELEGKGKKLFSYEAFGYGEQHIRVIPELDTVIVVTSDSNSSEMSNANELIQKYIVPAF